MLSEHARHTTTSQLASEKTSESKGAFLVDNREPVNPIQCKANNTGLPDNLKSGIENLSGHSMDDVKVHYNSSAPAQLNAHAYAQGNQIHVAPGQEKHLPHEAWHVVQQKEGRVKPTMQMKGKVNVNDDSSLEKEADVMGAKALRADPSLDNGARTFSPLKEIAQLVRKDVVTLGITHLVHLNEQGSLYQENFMQNEVAETRAGDSVVIETSEKVRSRRGPNQEQDPTRDAEHERDQVWTNALTHNDEVMPPRTFIRDGTFTDRVAAKRVINLASGTVPQTLMHAHALDQEVINLDSGHMAAADAVFAHCADEEVLNRIAMLLVEINPGNQFSFVKLGRDRKIETLVKQMGDNPKTAMSFLKQLIHSQRYSGAEGIRTFLQQMPEIITQTFRETTASLGRDFAVGDLAHGAEIGGADVVHMVNAFGFNPIEDETQVRHLATMLRTGGRLVITAEISGPTVSPLIPRDLRGATAAELLVYLHGVLERTQLGRYFTLGPLRYPHGTPVLAGFRRPIMAANAFTGAINTRHTMPSADTTDMPEDAQTVQITFIRNEEPIARG